MVRTLAQSEVKNGYDIAGQGISGSGGGGSIPIASSTMLGGVKIGDSMLIDVNGSISPIINIATGTTCLKYHNTNVKIKVYDNLSITNSWSTLDNMNILPLFAIGYGYAGDYLYRGTVSIRKDANDILSYRGDGETLNGVTGEIILFYIDND